MNNNSFRITNTSKKIQELNIRILKELCLNLFVIYFTFTLNITCDLSSFVKLWGWFKLFSFNTKTWFLLEIKKQLWAIDSFLW